MKNLLSKYKEYLRFPIDDADINQMCVYIESRQIKKLAYEYGEKILDIALEWAVERENYEACATIQKYITEVKRYGK